MKDNKSKVCALFLLLISGLCPHMLIGQDLGYILELKDEYTLDDVVASSAVLKSLDKKKDYTCLSERLNIWLVKKSLLEVSSFINHKAIESIQVNLQLEQRADPNDILFDKQWQYYNRGNRGAVDADIDLPEAWDVTTGGLTIAGDEIVVAVIDGGVNIDHPDLKENIWVNHGEIPDNDIDDDQNGYKDDYFGWNFNDQTKDVGNDGFGSWHGTPVAGIIGAVGNNAVGVSGINWNVKIMNLVANRTIADLIQAYEYIITMRQLYTDTNGDKGAFIVVTNTSLGITNQFAEDHPVWCSIYDALGGVGILNTVATTNNNIDIDADGDMPTSCLSDFLIGVTNITSWDAKEIDAGYGTKHIDIGAPGTSVFTINNAGDYGEFGGTSAAAPHVAGVIALLYSVSIPEFNTDMKADPRSMALTLRDLILSNVDYIEELENRSVSGGRLNAFKSINALNDLYDKSLVDVHEKGFITTVYPNPTRGHVTIEMSMSDQLSCIHDDPFSFKKSVTIRVINQYGNNVIGNKLISIDKGKHELQLDMSDFPAGVYHLHMTSRDFAFSKTINLIKLNPE